ncbi:hypothetical protein QBC34DRAFT_212631 [Podospora aff. communis PSN243]|uniref:Uncharacterized protein n=1 Tax=Podospora aff. communis PSN243 TaxID=3040156 RepID=A0AAV9G592_9PEZI|nr:hypothetical protein QBC34DRAFT_212631 [Podospora aff. communis PSN243]
MTRYRAYRTLFKTPVDSGFGGLTVVMSVQTLWQSKHTGACPHLPALQPCLAEGGGCPARRRIRHPTSNRDFASCCARHQYRRRARQSKRHLGTESSHLSAIAGPADAVFVRLGWSRFPCSPSQKRDCPRDQEVGWNGTTSTTITAKMTGAMCAKKRRKPEGAVAAEAYAESQVGDGDGETMRCVGRRALMSLSLPDVETPQPLL